jgi:DNA-binding transcriptional regulator YiaG
MKLSFRERAERRGRARGLLRDKSGYAVNVTVRPKAHHRSKVNTVTAALALARANITLLRAKRTIEQMLKCGEVSVHLPKVNMRRLTRELKAAGVTVCEIVSKPVDVRALRQRLGLTQEQFALKFNLGLDTVQSWEQGDRTPDRYANNYLRVIERDHAAAARAQEKA